MSMDSTLRRIFDESEKAEFLDAVSTELVTSDKAIVCFEEIIEGKRMSNFQYLQLGFRQTYEVIGFLDFIKEIIRDTDTDEDEEVQ